MDAAAGAEPSDAELITLVRGGDRAAYGVLYERHRAAAQRLARQYARSASDADDLTAEAFARVLDTLLAGRGPDTAFRAYLLTALRHTAFDRTRKDSKLRFTDDLTPHESAETPDDPVVADLENSLVARAFQSLPERWQAVLWHTQVEQESAEQVGEFLGITANAVTSLTFRAREGLRAAYLQAHLNDTAAEQCRTTTNRLGAWARGSLSKRETAQVEAHLDECDDCRALAAELTELNTSLRGLLAPLLLGGAAAGYVAMTSASTATGASLGAGSAAHAGEPGAVGGGAGWVAAHPWWLAAAGAGVVAAIVVTTVALVGGSGSHQVADEPGPVVAPMTTSTGATTTEDTSTVEAVMPPGMTLLTTAPSGTTATHTTPSHTTTAPTSTAAPTTSAPTTTPTTTSALSTTSSSSAITTPSSTTSSTPSSSTTSTTTATPAAVGAPAFAQQSLTAPGGSSAAVSFSVTNAGGTDSATQTLTIDTPDGVSVTGASGSTGPAAAGFRGRSSWRYRAEQPTTDPVTDPALTCTDATCHYIVPAATTLTVTVTLAIAPDAEDGDVSLIVPDSTPVTLPVTVTSGLTVLRLGTVDTEWVAGRGFDGLPLRGVLADGVTVAPSVTLPLAVPSATGRPVLRLRGPQASCDYDKAQLTMTCRPISISGSTASFGTFTLMIGDNAQGTMPMTAQAGGHALAVLNATGAPIVIAPAPTPTATPTTTTPPPGTAPSGTPPPGTAPSAGTPPTGGGAAGPTP